MKVNMKKAEELVPVSRTTLYNDKKNNVFTSEKDAKGRTVVDVAELQRVYGNLNSEKKESNSVQSDKSEPKSQSKSSNSSDIKMLEERINSLEDSRNREREILESQIDHLKETLAKAQDGQKNLTLLLEDHTNKEGQGGDKWQKMMTEQQDTFANTIKEINEKNTESTKEAIKQALEEQARKQEEERERRRQAIKKQREEQARKQEEEEKNKGFFQKLFG